MNSELVDNFIHSPLYKIYKERVEVLIRSQVDDLLKPCLSEAEVRDAERIKGFIDGLRFDVFLILLDEAKQKEQEAEEAIERKSGK